jgi:hypothetical protein
MKCKECRELFFLYQERSLPEAEKSEFEKHRRACPSCDAFLLDLETSTRLFVGQPAPVPVPDWERSWQKIAAAVEPRPRLKIAWPAFPRWALVAGGFMVFFILGVAFARLGFFPARTPALSSPEPAFIYTAGDYFAALQPVMASYANVPASGDGSAADQARVRRLLSDLYLLKLRAEKLRDVSLQHLLGDIELVLLEIAHLDRSDPEQVRQVGAMIQEKGISLKMKVYKFEGRKPVRI